MSTHTYKKCPHCGRTYESYTTYTKPSHWGTPYKRCNYCGGRFVDYEMKEMALELDGPQKVTGFNCIMHGFMFGLMGVLMLTLQNDGTKPLWVYIVGGILCVIWICRIVFAFKNRKEFDADNEAEYAASEKRLQNREYARALKELGYKVPDKYL